MTNTRNEENYNIELFKMKQNQIRSFEDGKKFEKLHQESNKMPSAVSDIGLNKNEMSEKASVNTSKHCEHEESLLKTITDWGTHSSAHGVASMSRKSSLFAKIFWVIVMTASWSYMGYLVTKTFVEYFDYKYDSGIEIITERPTTFPAIDICNLSPYQTVLNDTLNKIKSEKLNDDFFNYNSQTSTNNITHKNDADIFIKEVLHDYEDRSSRNQLDLNSLGFNLTNMLLNCKYQRKSCTYKDFTQYHNFFYGNCYRFNGGQNSAGQNVDLKMINQAGWNFGLQLELYTGNQNPLTYRNGFVILVHNQTKNDFSYPEDDGILISPGFETNIALSKRLVEILPTPYNDCMGDFSDKTFEYLIKKSTTMQQMKNVFKMDKYDQNMCLKMCFQKYIIDKCNCGLLNLPPYFLDDNQLCDDPIEQNCSSINDPEFYGSNADDNCFIQCPDNCIQSKYDTQISFSNFPSEWYLNNYYENQNSYNFQFFDTKVALLNIYFNELSYLHVYQTPSLTAESLLATIGGHFGLFAGWSVLTLMETIDLLIDIVCYFHHKNKKEKK
jgi:hypothetical protein